MARSFTRQRHITRALLLVVIALAARSSQASILITYSINIDQPVNVTDISFWERAGDTQSLAFPYSANGIGTTEIKSLYLNPPYPDASFILGLVTDLPGDLQSGTAHVVLMMNEVAAAYIGSGTRCFQKRMKLKLSTRSRI